MQFSVELQASEQRTCSIGRVLCSSWMDERRTAGSDTEATDTSRGSAVSVRVANSFPPVIDISTMVYVI